MDVKDSDSENDSDYVLEEDEVESDVELPQTKLEDISVSRKRKMDSIFDEMLDSEIKYTKTKMSGAVRTVKTLNNARTGKDCTMKKPKAFDVFKRHLWEKCCS